MRIGECPDLAPDCLRQVGLDQWALHVPLATLHTARLVPADPEVRQLVASLVALRALARPAHLARSAGFLLPRAATRSLYRALRLAVAEGPPRARRAGPRAPH